MISGAKTFVPLADRSSHFLVIARNNGGLDAFVVDREAAGLTISEREKHMGLKALPTCGLELERVEVPASARLGGEAGCDVRRLLDGGRAGLAAVMTGVSRAVLEYCVPYTKDRIAFDEAIARSPVLGLLKGSVARAALEPEVGLPGKTDPVPQRHNVLKLVTPMSAPLPTWS